MTAYRISEAADGALRGLGEAAFVSLSDDDLHTMLRVGYQPSIVAAVREERRRRAFAAIRTTLQGARQ